MHSNLHSKTRDLSKGLTEEPRKVIISDEQINKHKHHESVADPEFSMGQTNNLLGPLFISQYFVSPGYLKSWGMWGSLEGENGTNDDLGWTT